jgi:SAM-dependent methyltransferase
LPFPDGAFDAAMAIFTMHHWSDQPRGLSELGRVATRIVIATIDTAVGAWFWLTDYFPEIGEWDRGHFMTLDELRSRLSSPSVLTIPIPHDCHDGFLAAYWRRPRAYLDPDVRAGISTFALIHDDARERGLRRLEHDLNTGAWDRRYGHLRGIQELDAGYRLVVASS